MSDKKRNENAEYIEYIEKAINGDENAFSILIHSIELEMYKIARVKLNNEDDVYDAMQETIILIYKNLGKLKHKEYFKTWSTKILINECNKIYKKQVKTKKSIAIDENTNVDDSNDLFSKIENEYDFNKLLYILNSKERTIISLFYVDSYSINEISEILKITPGAAKTRLRRTKEKIKKICEKNKGGQLWKIVN